MLLFGFFAAFFAFQDDLGVLRAFVGLVSRTNKPRIVLIHELIVRRQLPLDKLVPFRFHREIVIAANPVGGRVKTLLFARLGSWGVCSVLESFHCWVTAEPYSFKVQQRSTSEYL